jgi:Resolvase, N terminal domain
MTVPLRAALYLRVSTARQAEHDVSIPDQKRQGEAYCALRGYQLVETYVEPGASATNDRRPEFQRMIEAGTSKPTPFDVVIFHSFSRFFRDHFELEFYVRKLAKDGVKLVSITQEMGDDPRQLSPRASSRTCPASRGGGRRGSHQGVEGRSAQNPCRCIGRKIGYDRRSQFCSEVADGVTVKFNS